MSGERPNSKLNYEQKTGISTANKLLFTRNSCSKPPGNYGNIPGTHRNFVAKHQYHARRRHNYKPTPSRLENKPRGPTRRGVDGRISVNKNRLRQPTRDDYNRPKVHIVPDNPRIIKPTFFKTSNLAEGPMIRNPTHASALTVTTSKLPANPTKKEVEPQTLGLRGMTFEDEITPTGRRARIGKKYDKPNPDDLIAAMLDGRRSGNRI